MSFFSPWVIGPSIQVQLKAVAEGGYKNFMCVCNALFKDEPSYRCHLNSHHKLINDMICQFEDVVKIRSLTKLNFALLGDSSQREQWEDVLGSEEEQKLRITKWLHIRFLIRHSGLTAIRTDEDARQTRVVSKKTQKKV
jgi:hypothetical protein